MKVGAILRTFAPRPEMVEEQVEHVVEAVKHMCGTGLVQRIDIMIPTHPCHKERDCGELKNILSDRLAIVGKISVCVSSAKFDLYCGILNFAIMQQTAKGMSHSLILSPGAREYATRGNISLMMHALESGAKVAGLAIAEIEQSVLQGRIANTCALWDNIALMSVGGFDFAAADAKVGCNRMYAAFEETIPLIRLVETFGPCIAPIKPVDAAVWKLPTDARALERHHDKMRRRETTQKRHALSVGASFQHITNGVMLDYRQ